MIPDNFAGGRGGKLRALNRLGTDSAYDLAKAKTTDLHNLVFEAQRIHANNELLARRKILPDTESSGAGWALYTLRFSSVLYEHTRLCALWDSPAPDRASIPTVAALLYRTDVFHYAKQEFVKKFAGHDADRVDAALRRFQKSYERASLFPPWAYKRALLTRLRTNRDTYSAHNLPPEPFQRYDSMREEVVVAFSIKIAQALQYVFHAGSVELDELTVKSNHDANDLFNGLMWKKPNGAHSKS